MVNTYVHVYLYICIRYERVPNQVIWYKFLLIEIYMYICKTLYDLPFRSIAQPRQKRVLSCTSQLSTDVRRSIKNKSPPLSLKYSLTNSTNY